MICVSIGRGRHRHVIAEHRHLVEQGARLVELRLDYINGEVNVKRLVADRPCPVLITCRRMADGGKFSGSEEQRQLLLRTAITEGVEYVDLDYDIAGMIPRFGRSKRIVSMHDFRKTPENLEEIHRRLCGLDPDIVKIAVMANHPHDNLRVLDMIRQSEVPTIGVCMGDIGIPSRILAGKFGAPITFATFHHERAMAPGQLTFQQMMEVYNYDKIDANTEVYGVAADPIGHSLSPLIHNAAFQHYGMNKVYIPFRVPREDLSRFIDEAPQLGIRGLSITIPHKEDVIKKLTEVDASVRGIGAANTVVFEGQKRLGYNTDHHAAMSSLEDVLRADNPQEKRENPLQGKSALVLGAGGVGKAIIYGLSRRGVQVVVSDGVLHQAATLAKNFNCRSVDWGARHTVTADLLFNCTPVGMHPNVDETPFDKHHLRPSMIVFDVVYNPENTLLVKEARGRNCTVITGIDMFVRQACLQFKIFTGRDGPAEVMRETIRRAIGAAKY
ncbi:MAG: shikimate dehydrogenase [Thermoguttaceae bacterium]|jgi:3-dehydroquinate dehydratase/shikimate dehydrogenase